MRGGSAEKPPTGGRAVRSQIFVPARYREHGSSSDDDDAGAEGRTEDNLGARLLAIGAEQALEPLRRECVDLAALSLMGEAELREIGVPLGPRVKILNSGLCAARRRRGGSAASAAESDGAHTMWDMEVVADVEALQQTATPRMCLHVRSGRVHRMAGGIQDAGILVNEADVPFVVLMSQVCAPPQPAAHALRGTAPPRPAPCSRVAVLPCSSGVLLMKLFSPTRSLFFSSPGRGFVSPPGAGGGPGSCGRVGSCCVLLAALLGLAHQRTAHGAGASGAADMAG